MLVRRVADGCIGGHHPRLQVLRIERLTCRALQRDGRHLPEVLRRIDDVDLCTWTGVAHLRDREDIRVARLHRPSAADDPDARPRVRVHAGRQVEHELGVWREALVRERERIGHDLRHRRKPWIRLLRAGVCGERHRRRAAKRHRCAHGAQERSHRCAPDSSNDPNRQLPTLHSMHGYFSDRWTNQYSISTGA